MKFVDEAQVRVRAGDGGRGCVSFNREKYKPHGGPNGGDGGDGGDVVFEVDPGITTLLDFRHQPLIKAGRGEHGRGKQQYGKRGASRVLRVPPGTIIRDADTGDVLADLRGAADRAVVARGGRGGRGNMHFATSTNQAPRYAQPGIPGEERTLHLELHLMADVGLVGYPNVGKSTFITRVSAARPRIADYPFTTLVPHLGVVRFDEEGSFVLADIPGLIEGAHRGVGLGHRFLRHLSRTMLLVHLLDISGLTGRDPLDDYDAINHELAAFDPTLASKPQIVVANKLDLVEARDRYPDLQARFAARGVELWAVSAATGEGMSAVVHEVGRRWRALRAEEATREGYAGQSSAPDKGGSTNVRSPLDELRVSGNTSVPAQTDPLRVSGNASVPAQTDPLVLSLSKHERGNDQDSDDGGAKGGVAKREENS